VESRQRRRGPRGQVGVDVSGRALALRGESGRSDRHLTAAGPAGASNSNELLCCDVLLGTLDYIISQDMSLGTNQPSATSEQRFFPSDRISPLATSQTNRPEEQILSIPTTSQGHCFLIGIKGRRQILIKDDLDPTRNPCRDFRQPGIQ
jgi:hypothetical protein